MQYYNIGYPFKNALEATEKVKMKCVSDKPCSSEILTVYKFVWVVPEGTSRTAFILTQL